MVSMLALSVVDRGFIDGVMVSMLTLSVVDRGFIGGVMVSILALSAVDRRFESHSVQIKEYRMGICCFSGIRAKTNWLGSGKCVGVECHVYPLTCQQGMLV